MLTLARVVEEEAKAALAVQKAAFAAYVGGIARETAPDYTWFERTVAEGAVWWLLNDTDRVGVAVLSRADTTLSMDSLCIATDRQAQGLGLSALAALEAHAKREGATEIRLYTVQKYTQLVAFYSRSGYRVDRIGPHPKGRDDRLRVFMVKSLI